MSKALKRAERQARRQEEFERTKERLLERVQLDRSPRVAATPGNLGIKTGVPLSSLSVSQSPKAAFSGSRFGVPVKWCVTRKDVDGMWTWGEARAWSEEEWASTIHPAMTCMVGLTWGEVDQQSSGEGHKHHHEQELATLCSEAQERWLDLGLAEFETLFRFRMGNTKRFWGFIIGGHFFGVWWEREHRIYPTS